MDVNQDTYQDASDDAIGRLRALLDAPCKLSRDEHDYLLRSYGKCDVCHQVRD